MTAFRLLHTGHHSAAWNMALDEVLLHEIATGASRPALRFYGWQPAAISIGYFQSLEAEVDTAKCRELGVDIVRRQTGGGAVLHADEVTYSIHLPLSGNFLPLQILESYRKICHALIRGLQRFEIEAQFVPLNDLVANGQKISGNAQTRKQGVLLQHGTILKSVDVEKMFDLLKVPDEKLKGKLISDIKQRVTSLDAQAGKKFSFEEISAALAEGFAAEFPEVEFILDKLTAAEENAAERLAAEKYAQNVWNQMR